MTETNDETSDVAAGATAPVKTIAEGQGAITVTEGDEGWPRPLYLAAACQLMGYAATVTEQAGRPFRIVLPHSERVADQIRTTAQKMEDTAEDPRLGATGDKPDGVVDPSDDGGIQFAVGAMCAEELVILSFGKPVAWLGMSPKDAREFADMLNAQADKVDEWHEAEGVTDEPAP